MSKISYFFIISFLLFLTFFSFSQEDKTKNLQENTQTLTIKNGAGPGIDTQVPSRPQRVIFLNSSSLDLWLGAGGAEKVVGYAKIQSAPQGIYEKVPPYSAVLSNTMNVSAEKILALKPDLVVGNGVSSSQMQLGEVIRQAGVGFLTIANNSLADTFFELTLYGQLTGHPELAEKEARRLEQEIEKITSSYQGKTQPKVALIWGTPNSFSLLVPHSRQGEFLALAGGGNIVEESNAASRYIPISLEYIAQKDPDYIFFINMGDRQKIQLALEKLLQTDSAWQLLRAVRENKVYMLPPELFTAHYGLSIDKSISYLNNILYPAN